MLEITETAFSEANEVNFRKLAEDLATARADHAQAHRCVCVCVCGNQVVINHPKQQPGSLGAVCLLSTGITRP